MALFVTIRPKGVLEALFSLFERNPDLPAVLVYANEGFNMAGSLSSRDVPLKSLGRFWPTCTGDLDRHHGRPDRRPPRAGRLATPVRPLHQGQRNRIDPEFRGWGWRKPPVEFRPTPFIPQP